MNVARCPESSQEGARCIYAEGHVGKHFAKDSFSCYSWDRPALPSTPRDRTLAITVGRWGGFYRLGGGGCWRVCLGFVAITYLRAEFTHVMRAWLDAGEPS